MTNIGLSWEKIGGRQSFHQPNLVWGAPHLLHIQGPYNLHSNLHPHKEIELEDCEQSHRNAWGMLFSL